MLIDICWVIVSVGAGLGFLHIGQPWHALAWAGVAGYALQNWLEHRLKGSKYDY